MFYTGYLDFWFTDRSLVERVQPFVALGVHDFCVFAWRQAPIAELTATCAQYDARLFSTFDGEMGALADPADNARTLRTWAESLEMAEQHRIACLYIFSNQIDRIDGRERVRALSGNFSQAEQYANLLAQTERILRLVEQTSVEVRVECLSRNHFVGAMAVDTPQVAVDWVRRMHHPQFRFTFDAYHQQRGAGDLLTTLTTSFDVISGVHIGDAPTRQEPGTGEINFTNLAISLRKLGYDGEIGLEFMPSKDEASALAAVHRLFPLTED
ncbi:MAG: TIM barrel protein [Caldilineaceae bacterium]|jgi:hydroxypyruvate isomerase|nr:TIM barrel protein [Caldilineaceae bacterium]